MSDQSNVVEIWTDGEAKPNPGQGAWAFIVCVDGIELTASGSPSKKTTNIRMELTAAIESLKGIYASLHLSTVLLATNLNLYTDSNYVLGVINRTHTRFKVNTDLVSELQRLTLDLPFTGVYMADSNIMIARCHEMVRGAFDLTAMAHRSSAELEQT